MKYLIAYHLTCDNMGYYDEELYNIVRMVYYGKSENTIKSAYKKIRHFLKIVGKRHHQVKPSDIERFIAMKIPLKKDDEGKDRRTYVKLTLIHLQKFYEYLDSIGDGDYKDLIEFIARRKRDIKTPKMHRRDFLSRDEIEKFMKVLENEPPQYRLIFILMLKYGMRIAEVLNLKKENVLEDHRAIRYVSKGEKEQYVFIEDDDDWRLVLKVKNMDNSKYMFHYFNGRPISYRSVQSTFKRLLRQAGFPEERVKRLRLHDLRRTSAITVYNMTNDIVAVKEWLGHEKIETTMIYLDMGSDRFKRKREISRMLSKNIGKT